MSFIVDFYKELDTVNLIIFWGVIIVVLLLLTFAIIIANKNKKLERIIQKSGIDVDTFDDELAIKEDKSIPIKENQVVSNENIDYKEEESKPISSSNSIISEQETFIEMPSAPSTKEIELPIKEDKFIAEEHVMEYNNNQNNNLNLEKQITKEETVNSLKTNNIQNIPYQKNILREAYPNQTSPIGLAKNNSKSEIEKNRAIELHNILNEQNDIKNDTKKSVITEETLLNQKKYAVEYNQSQRKGNYLEELSKKLANDNPQTDISRTEYELKQEEEAIISYEELMKKKDSIKTIDEEEAVISIGELMERKAKQEKIYNITKDEENEKFIDELKHFRSDL